MPWRSRLTSPLAPRALLLAIGTTAFAMALVACPDSTQIPPKSEHPVPMLQPSAGASASVEAPSAGPSTSAAAPRIPSGRLASVEPAKDGLSLRAKILFKNPTNGPCRFLSYKLTWGTTSKEIKLDALVIPAGENRERWLKVHPEDGDLNDLTEVKSLVQVQTDCQ